MVQIIKNKAVRLLIGYAGIIALFQTLSIPAEDEMNFVADTNSFLSMWVCILSGIVYDKVCGKVIQAEERNASKRITGTKIVAFLYSVALAIALTAGKYLETVENLNVADPAVWWNIVLLSFYFIPFVLAGWQWLESVWEKAKIEKGGKKVGCRDFFLQWLLIFVCWIPVFLAFYPGAFVYDACDEYVQVATRNFTTHHPLAHVLLLGGLVCAGHKFFASYNIGIAFYTLFQMLLLSGVFSYTVCYIKEKISNKYIIRGTLLFYGLFPVIPMYAVCSSKDAIFTAAFLVVVIKMLQLMENTESFLKQKGNLAVSILAAVVMMLFRNNGMYAYIVWIPFVIAGCILMKKEKRSILKIAVIMVSSFLIFEGASKVLTLVTHADDSESQEIMTVPIQQMVRTFVYSPDTYTAEEKKVLFEMIPKEDMHLYNARLSDLVKSKFNNQAFNQDKGRYLQLWAKIGLRKPLIYLNAWLMTSYGYWYPDVVINVYGGNAVHTFTYRDSSYFGFETEYPGTRESKFPWLEEQYRKMSLELYQQKVPGISMLFSPGFLFWVFMFCVCFCLKKGRWDKVTAFGGILLLWATAILGPTYLVRYVLILWFALPVMLAGTKE